MSSKYLQRNWASWESGTGAQFPKRLLNRVRVSIHRHPSRPDIGDIEAATPLIQYIEKDDQNRLDVIDRQVKSSEVSPELFNVLKEMRRGLIKSSLGLLAPRKPQVTDSTLEAKKLTGHSREKMSLIKLATLIELSAKKATQELNLQHKLMDQIEWLPDSIGNFNSPHHRFNLRSSLHLVVNSVTRIIKSLGLVHCCTEILTGSISFCSKLYNQLRLVTLEVMAMSSCLHEAYSISNMWQPRV
ncbi:hypothetical protein Bca52824_017796 [Brassica carinata]|uniref:Uncharacterized protein n=1 Tax=Brassica carinata TaxID=52824 RepID=A0A8X7VNW0_BRACI|nr:hypothetical protein Bca52824_017796 [Brassica carinata]